MPASIGVNLRVTGHCRQGGRKYMEDFFSVAYQQTEDEKDLEYAFFGIYDGHGGGEAATFAKEHLMESIVRQKNFWSDKDEDVLKAIKEGYIATHYAMWKEQEKWPKTASGLPSTAGTTASVAFIRRGKIYIGHVGDSGIILGYQEPGEQPTWKARPLTKDHKPENANEMSRIEQCGGKVVTKSGVPRVVWNRPRIGHKGPVRRSTPIDEIPFLAVARSLGDLWSYNSALDEFVVSPDPDTCCIPIDTETFRCLIFGTDGLWNMISPSAAVSIVQVAEQHNERTVLATADNTTPQQQPQQPQVRSKVWINPSKCLVERALERWSSTRMRADNTSVITLMLDPPGPPRAEVIKSQNRNRRSEVQQTDNPADNTQNQDNQDQHSPEQSNGDQNATSPVPAYPENGLEIVTVYREEPAPLSPLPVPPQPADDIYIVPDTPPSQQQQQQEQPQPQQSKTDESKAATSDEHAEAPVKRYTEEYLDKIHREVLNTIQVNKDSQPAGKTETKAAKVDPPAAKADVLVVEKPSVEPAVQPETSTPAKQPLRVETIQINEVSSSSSLDKASIEDETPCARCTRSHDVGRRSLRAGLAEHKLAKPSRSSSESPKRKTRLGRPLVMQRNTTGAAKREHSEPDTDSANGATDARGCGDDGRLAAGPTTNSEPPQKLRRSRSLGPTVVPKDFTLRSGADLKSGGGASALGRCLRERDRATGGRHSLAAPSTTSASTFRRLNGTRSFTPVRSPMQTRNRVKRLNNK